MRLPILLALSAVGCTPHDGEVTGSYVAYFSEGSSLVLSDIQNARRVDLTDPDAQERFGLVPVDCRDLDEEHEAQRLPGVDYAAECRAESGQKLVPQWFDWLQFYAFYKKEEALDPWRVEAVLTGEHDLQLTLHQDVPRFGDFRVGWVIDPIFHPQVCRDKEGGGAELVEVDGDWLEQWSAEEGGTMFYLNAGAYQINPSTGQDYWYLEQDLLAGYTFGRFEDDALYGHATDYTQSFDPGYYPIPLYFHSYQGELPAPRSTYEDWVADMKDAFTYGDDAPSDFELMGKSEFPVELKVEDNGWRIDPDDAEEVEYESSANGANGLENWIGINASWVHFDLDPDQLAALEPGRQDPPVTGTFQVQLDGLASATKVLVNGSFSIDRIRDDVWGYSPTLDEIKREENNTPECGEDRLTTEE